MFFIYIFQDYDGHIIAVSKDFQQGLNDALNIVGNQKMYDPYVGEDGIYWSIREALAEKQSKFRVTYSNLNESLDYNLTCDRWEVFL